MKDYFAPRVLASGSDAIIYRPLENKIFKEMHKDSEQRNVDFDFDTMDLERFKQLFDEGIEDWRHSRRNLPAKGNPPEN